MFNENVKQELKGKETIMEKNTLYLLEMGMNDANISTDVKNHRVRVTENINISYKGKMYNMFFEFRHGAHLEHRTTNKRTGAPLRKPIATVLIQDGIYIDTQYETQDGAYRLSDLEKEANNEHLGYTKANILKIVNRYKVGAPFTDVCLIETTAADIIRNKGGYREKEILGDDKDFHTEGDSYFIMGETWNEDHRIVKCYKREWKAIGQGRRRLEVVDACEVDLITGEITG